MIFEGKQNELTGRVEKLTFVPQTFEEERLLEAMKNLFVSDEPGGMAVQIDKRIFIWKKRTCVDQEVPE